MNEDITKIYEKLDRLRSDLSATWLALMATHSVLTPQQQQQVLAEFAALSAQKQQMLEGSAKDPGQAKSFEQVQAKFQASEQHVYALLQGAQTAQRLG